MLLNLLAMPAPCATRAPMPVALAVPGAYVPKPIPQTLAEDAQVLLEEAGGDAEKARLSMMGYTLAFLEEAEPELYQALKSRQMRPDVHAALVEITWDAIAAFMPLTHTPTPTPAAQKKLAAIARAGCDGTLAVPAVLDVGCGNGLLLPFVAACGAPPDGYRGIDLSARMVGCAAATYADDASYAGVRFDEISFGEVATGEERYDTIFFNGALQFFDPAEALASAATLLKSGPTSRLVICHLNGAAFVRKERAESPMTVISTMPTLEEWAELAAPLGLDVVTPAFFGSDPAEIQAAMEDFYLIVLRWDAEHGGSPQPSSGSAS